MTECYAHVLCQVCWAGNVAYLEPKAAMSGVFHTSAVYVVLVKHWIAGGPSVALFEVPYPCRFFITKSYTRSRKEAQWGFFSADIPEAALERCASLLVSV